jgi:recombination protein RecA
VGASEDARRKAIIARLHRTASDPPERQPSLSTGNPDIDTALGGGLPRGRIVELFGPEDCGKTALALRTVAAVQRAGGTAALIDADRTFDAARAAALGVSIEGVVVARPASAEEAMEMVGSLASSGALDLVIVDSAAALASEAELEASLEEADARWQSEALWRGLRRVSAAARRGDACILFVNQIRAGKSPSSPPTSAGGSALKLYSSLRIEMCRAGMGRARLRAVRDKRGAAKGVAEFAIG